MVEFALVTLNDLERLTVETRFVRPAVPVVTTTSEPRVFLKLALIITRLEAHAAQRPRWNRVLSWHAFLSFLSFRRAGRAEILERATEVRLCFSYIAVFCVATGPVQVRFGA